MCTSFGCCHYKPFRNSLTCHLQAFLMTCTAEDVVFTIEPSHLHRNLQNHDLQLMQKKKKLPHFRNVCLSNSKHPTMSASVSKLFKNKHFRVKVRIRNLLNPTNWQRYRKFEVLHRKTHEEIFDLSWQWRLVYINCSQSFMCVTPEQQMVCDPWPYHGNGSVQWYLP